MSPRWTVYRIHPGGGPQLTVVLIGLGPGVGEFTGVFVGIGVFVSVAVLGGR